MIHSSMAQNNCPEEALACPICINQFRWEEVPSLIKCSKCVNIFHPACISKMKKNDDCACCRQKFVAQKLTRLQKLSMSLDYKLYRCLDCKNVVQDMHIFECTVGAALKKKSQIRMKKCIEKFTEMIHDEQYDLPQDHYEPDPAAQSKPKKKAKNQHNLVKDSGNKEITAAPIPETH